MPYPLYRPRRLRESPLLRKMVRETTLKADDFMLPLFTVHGRGLTLDGPPAPRLKFNSWYLEARECR